jgi:membrane-associated phospholipid phosphatase
MGSPSSNSPGPELVAPAPARIRGLDGVRSLAARIPSQIVGARVRASLWPVLLALVAVDAVALRARGLTIVDGTARPVLGAVATLLLIVLAYGPTGRSAALARTANAGAELIAFGVIGEVLSYALSSTRFPLLDAAFLAADRALGFEWSAWTATAHARPWSDWVLRTAYNSIMPQLTVCTMYLALRGRRVEGFMRALAATGLVTVVVSAVVPAIGHLPNAPHVPHLLALRDGTLTAINLRNLQGLISFPSFHAAVAALIMLAVYRERWIGPVAVVLNAVMLVATISVGGHYLVDVLAGGALAAGAWKLTARTRV